MELRPLPAATILICCSFTNSRMALCPINGEKVKRVFEELKEAVAAPDLIFTHRREDAHQDHRLLSELTWNTFRNHFILGIRDSEIRWRHGRTECLRTARPGNLRAESGSTHEHIPLPGQQALV